MKARVIKRRNSKINSGGFFEEYEDYKKNTIIRLTVKKERSVLSRESLARDYSCVFLYNDNNIDIPF